MKKIRLDIDQLDVQSFATVLPDGARGTGRGADSAPSYAQTYEGQTCPRERETCWLGEETDLCITFDLSCTCQPGQFPC